jgi:hypothetical protein
MRTPSQATPAGDRRRLELAVDPLQSRDFTGDGVGTSHAERTYASVFARGGLPLNTVVLRIG